MSRKKSDKAKSPTAAPPVEGVVYKTEAGSADEIKEETRKLEGVSFDAHFFTEKIIQFGKMLTGVPLYDYQYATVYRIIYSVITLEGATITMLFSRQSGKSESLAFVVNALGVILPLLAKIVPDLDQFRDGIKIGLFAPQSDQVQTTHNRVMLRIGSENAEMVMDDPDIQVYLESYSRFQLSNGSFMLGQTASKQSKIESKTYDLVLIEETQDMDSYMIQKSIEPMVSATGGTIVKVGTTGTHKGDFWYEILNNRNLSRKQPDPRLHYHWQFDYKAIIADKRKQFERDGKLFHLNYEKDIMRKRQKWGETSQAFKLSYALIWDVESGMLITDKEYEKICNKKKGFAEPDEDDLIIAGLDIGKEIANTILTIGRVVENTDDEFAPPKKEIIAWIELPNGMDYELQHHALLDAIVEFNVQVLYADYTGVGKPVVDRLMYACGEYVNIVPYTFSTSSKSEMWFAFISDLQAKRLIVPAHPKVRTTPEYQHFEEQMLNCEKRYEGPYLVCQKAQGFLDDYVDSAALMCLAGNTEAPEEIEEDDFNPFLDQMNAQRSNLSRLSW